MWPFMSTYLASTCFLSHEPGSRAMEVLDVLACERRESGEERGNKSEVRKLKFENEEENSNR